MRTGEFEFAGVCLERDILSHRIVTNMMRSLRTLESLHRDFKTGTPQSIHFHDRSDLVQVIILLAKL